TITPPAVTSVIERGPPRLTSSAQLASATPASPTEHASSVKPAVRSSRLFRPIMSNCTKRCRSTPAVLGRDLPPLRPDHAADAAPPPPVRDHLQPHGVHQLRQIVADAVGDRFVEDALAAERVQVHLQALEFHAYPAGPCRARAEPD